MIRVQKNLIGSRCFGSSVVVKDNFTFGIKETQKQLANKVSCEDNMLSFEAKRSLDRKCEFWLEFENGTRMSAEILEL